MRAKIEGKWGARIERYAIAVVVGLIMVALGHVGNDRFTAHDAQAVIAPRDFERRALIRIICKEHPAECEEEGIVPDAY